MLVMWVSLYEWRTKRDATTRSGTNAGTNGGGGAVRRGPGPRRERRRGAGANVNTADDPDRARDGGHKKTSPEACGRYRMPTWSAAECQDIRPPTHMPPPHYAY